ncbi:hypothetical protein EAY39_15250 [Vibrio anguillarum]|uniref:hypothetical protein n=2 Tax=Vibrio anguillarum TaxID=55601 RepID=UPI0018C254E2|nr:hypothetical protein [Vibrio anguillarum]MBF4342120.1 hypothetical protein [Vibrio anguillarum]
MSDLFLDLYQKMLSNRAHKERIHYQEFLRNKFAQERDFARKEEAQLLANQRDARNTFHANLYTRKMDLNNAANLYPLSKTVHALYQHQRVGMSELVAMDILSGQIREKNMPPKKMHEARFRPYNIVGALCNDANPHLQCNVRLATLLFFRFFKPDFGAALNKSHFSLVNRLTSHWVAGLIGSFLLIGERSSQPLFSLFWGMPISEQNALRGMDSVEGRLFSAFCPSESILTDDLAKMRELLWIVRYDNIFKNTIDSNHPLMNSAEVSFNALLDNCFDEKQGREFLLPGIKAMIKKWSYEPLSRAEHEKLTIFYDNFPLFYLVSAAWLLFFRLNPSAADSMITLIDEVANRKAQYKVRLGVANFSDLLNMDVFFPEVTNISFNAEVLMAYQALNVDIPAMAGEECGFIVPQQHWFAKSTNILNSAKDYVSLGGDLEAHLPNNHSKNDDADLHAIFEDFEVDSIDDTENTLLLDWFNDPTSQNGR